MTSPAPRPRRFHRRVNGILLLDKPLGLSSNEALQKVRVLFGALKAGHGGSLDPLASGMLPVCFGHATKVCGELLGGRKTYSVRLRLGQRTASGDLETAVMETAPVPKLTESEVRLALESFRGTHQQIPPMHSAIRLDGKRLYELARRGESVERESRAVLIDHIRLDLLDLPDIEFTVTCSKGTYIRTLAEDLAGRLGTVGHLQALRRTAVSPFQAHAPVSLEAVQQAVAAGGADTLLLAADIVFDDLPSVRLDQQLLQSFLKGQTVQAPVAPAERLRVYDKAGLFIGLGSSEAGKVRPTRLFVDIPQEPAPADFPQQAR